MIRLLYNQISLHIRGLIRIFTECIFIAQNDFFLAYNEDRLDCADAQAALSFCQKRALDSKSDANYSASRMLLVHRNTAM